MTQGKKKGRQSKTRPATQQSQTNSSRCGGRAFYKQRNEVGMGVRVDLESGRTIYNPGLSSEQVITEGIAEEYLQHHEDVETRFPIPSERELRRPSQSNTLNNDDGSRKIRYQGDGTTTSSPSQLPFSPPGLMWKGQPAITTSRLLAHKDNNLISPTSRKKATARRGRML